MEPSEVRARYRAEQERKERELPGGSTAFQARRGGRVLTRYWNRHLQKLVGLRSTQVDVMAAVKAARNTPISTVARGLGMAPCTLSRSLQRLEANGLVRTEVGRDSRRERWTKLTEAGEECLRLAQQTIETIPQIRMQTRLGKEMCRRMRTDSEKIASAAWTQTREEMFVEANLPFWPSWYYEKRWTGWTEEEIVAGKRRDPEPAKPPDDASGKPPPGKKPA